MYLYNYHLQLKLNAALITQVYIRLRDKWILLTVLIDRNRNEKHQSTRNDNDSSMSDRAEYTMEVAPEYRLSCNYSLFNDFIGNSTTRAVARRFGKRFVKQ